MLNLCVLVSFAQKIPLDHTVYDQWQSISNVLIDANGKYTAYQVNLQEGDGQLFIQHKLNKTNIVIPRGAQAGFSEDGRYVFGKIKPFFAETRKAKIDKKKADELPKDSLFIYDIQNGHLEKIANVKSFQSPSKYTGSLAYLMDKKGDINKEGSDLMIYNLKTQFKTTVDSLFHFIAPRL
jgi:hypothetical protein